MELYPRAKLKSYFCVSPKYSVNLNVGISESAERAVVRGKYSNLNLVMQREAQYLRDRFGILQSFDLTLTPQNAGHILAFYRRLIPLFHKPAYESYVRSSLATLLNRLQNREDFASEVRLEIAKSDIRSGIPDSGTARSLRDHPAIKKEWSNEISSLESAYGANFVTQSWGGAVSRDRTLVYYFRNHLDMLRNKKILHVAAEHMLGKWIRKSSESLQCEYATLNASGATADYCMDLVSPDFQDGVFDLIICHRVLEHIVDDRAAVREMYRILKPGGMLNISVPQAVHLRETQDWMYPDATHHGHVRQYASDFSWRLEEASFKVRVEDWLLRQPRDELLRNGAYPMRMYNAHKD